MKLQNGNGVIGGNFLASELADVRDFSDLFFSMNHNLITSILNGVGDIQDDWNYILNGLDVTFVTGLTCKISAGLAISSTGRYFTDDTVAFVASPGELFYVIVPEDIQFGVIANSDPTQIRKDLVEIRPIYNTFNSKNRQFRDPITGIVTTSLVDTRKQVSFEFQVTQGVAGSGTAANATPGWIKIAEIDVPPASANLTATSVLGKSDKVKWTDAYYSGVSKLTVIVPNENNSNITKHTVSTGPYRVYGKHNFGNLGDSFGISSLPPDRVFNSNNPSTNGQETIRYTKKNNANIYLFAQAVGGSVVLYYLNFSTVTNPIFTTLGTGLPQLPGAIVCNSASNIFHLLHGSGGVSSYLVTVDSQGVMTLGPSTVAITASSPFINDAVELTNGYIAVSYYEGVSNKIGIFRYASGTYTSGTTENVTPNNTCRLVRAGSAKFLAYTTDGIWVCTHSSGTLTQNALVALSLPGTPATVIKVAQFDSLTTRTAVLFNYNSKAYVCGLIVDATTVTQETPMMIDNQFQSSIDSNSDNKIFFYILDSNSSGQVSCLSHYKQGNKMNTAVRTFQYTSSDGSIKSIPNNYLAQMNDIYSIVGYDAAFKFMPGSFSTVVVMYRLTRDNTFSFRCLNDVQCTGIIDKELRFITHGIIDFYDNTGIPKRGDFMFLDCDGVLRTKSELLTDSNGIPILENPKLIGIVISDNKLELRF